MTERESNKDQWALITGASYGIGEDFARVFARGGFNLILTARSLDKLTALARNLSGEYGIKTEVLAKDLSLPGASEEIYTEIGNRGLRVDVLVNNAGFGLHGEFRKQDRKEQLNMIQLNVQALTDLTRILLPGMLERKKGRILNVASTAAFQPGSLMAVYYATKSYVLSFSEALNEELKGTGVSATCLCPGPTRSQFQKRAGLGDVPLFRYASMDSVKVAEAGYDGLMKEKPLVIPGFVNKLTAFMTRFVPRALVPPVVRALQSRRAV